MKDASDRKEIRKAEKAAKLTEQQHNEVVVQIMSHRNGRAWVHDTLESCHIFATSVSPNPYQTYFNEGERNVGSKLLARVTTAAPAEYILMMEEANGRDILNRNRDDQPANADDTSDGSVVSEYDPADEREYENK